MTKLVVPPMPTYKDAELSDWGFMGWQTAQREAALADELAEALHNLMSHKYEVDYSLYLAAKMKAAEVLSKHKEARNG